MPAIASRPTPPVGVEAAPDHVLRPDLDQVASWRLAGRQAVSEVQLFEATGTPPGRGSPARAVTVRFHPLGVLERVTDPAELLNTAHLLATVAGWVGAARRPDVGRSRDAPTTVPRCGVR